MSVISTPPVVVLLKYGALLVIDGPSDELKRLLERTLSYVRHVMDRDNMKAGRKSLPVDCYRYERDPDGLFPDKFVCGAGYMRKLAKTLRDCGYQVEVRDMKPHPRPAIFEPQWDRVEGIDWRYKQRTCLERLLKLNYGRIDCPTGYGKTFLIKLIPKLLPNAKIAVATFSVDVINDIYNSLCEDFPVVGLHTGKNDREGRRINCYSLKSLNHCTEPVDVLLIDEHYEAATDDNMTKLMSPGVLDARKYGFGANSEDRIDDAHFELEGILGPVVVNIPYQEAVDHGVIVPIEVLWLDVVSDVDPGDKFDNPVAKERHSIWRNSHRNDLIASAARAFPDEQVLITVFSVEHGLRLRKRLPEYEFCYSEGAFNTPDGREKLAQYLKWGLMSPDEVLINWDIRDKMRRDFESGKLRKAIATSVWKRGVNFRPLQVLIRADAKSSPIDNTQIPGRTSRLCDETGKKVGLIIDCADQFSKKFRREAYRRGADYRKHGWKQVKENSATTRQLELFGTF